MCNDVIYIRTRSRYLYCSYRGPALSCRPTTSKPTGPSASLLPSRADVPTLFAARATIRITLAPRVGREMPVVARGAVPQNGSLCELVGSKSSEYGFISGKA